MAVILHAAITFDGRLTPLPAGEQTPGATGFRNGRRASKICEWVGAQDPESDLHCEILTPAAAAVATALLAGDRVDELRLVVCPLVSGRREAATLTGPPTPEFLPAVIRLRLLSMEPAGDICLLRYEVKKRAASVATEKS